MDERSTLQMITEAVLSNTYFLVAFIALIIIGAIALRVALGKPDDDYEYKAD
ncbi:MAG: hypothetical protein U0T84_04040 [Chitinophagales bacterium]